MTIASATRERLPAVVAFCARHRLGVILFYLVLAAASLLATRAFLGVNTDTGKMFSDSLPWKQRSSAIDRAFPQNDDLLVAVIDARIPEEAEATAAALADRLRPDTGHFIEVRRPDALPYLQKNAFLLIDKDKLQTVLQQTIDAQPFLGQLVADPSLRGLFAALGLITEGVKRGEADLSAMQTALQGFHQALAAAAAGRPQPLSWENLLAGPLASEAGRYKFVLAKARLDYGALEPGGAATAALRQVAATLPYVAQGEARVRVTGSVALSDEEFATVAQGAVVGLVGSFLLVMFWLYLAVRSWRLMLPIFCTLLLGLVLTTGFAAVAVGTLNLISVAFAVLFVGIAVDFSIQFSVRLRERRFTYPDMIDALRETGRRAGSQILVAALATAAGFLAFSPTAFVGVAQLGVIAGVGMLIAFVCTLTFLPAMLCLCHPPRERSVVGLAWAARLDPVIARHHRVILAVFGVLGVIAIAVTPTIRFDGDPLHTKKQDTEAVRTLYDLMNDPVTNPYTIDALLPSLDQATAMADRLGKLPLVQDVLTLRSFIPTDQDAKLAMIQDAANLLGPSLAPPPSVPPVDAAALRRATQKLAGQLAAIAPKLPPDSPLRAMAGDAARLAQAGDQTLLETSEALTRFLPMQLDRLRLALSATRVTEADVPDELRRDWMLPDGRARLEVLPKSNVHNGGLLRQFVDSVLDVMPEAGGSAIWIVKSADTIIHAFIIAAVSAVIAIAVILALSLRRVADVLLVLTPLLLSSLLTVLLLVACGLQLNFANIIALPLLLGVGVSFNIYFVMNWRSGHTRFLGSATARAVMFSALTTATAFGSLALSEHPGTASMGELLLMSLFCTVTTTLVFVPALLSAMPHPHVPLGGIPGEKPV